MQTPKACHATLNYEELTTFLEEKAREFPDFVHLESIGKTPQGRNIWAVTLGARYPLPDDASADDPTSTRPALYVDANIHAVELTGSTACLAIIHFLAEASKTEEGRKRLEERTFYIIPRVSPDGAEHYLQTGAFVRSSPLFYPNQDWPDGLQAEDIDGDKAVRQMRILDPDGGWRVSARDPRVMVQRRPGDSGPFYHLFSEGIFHHFDGHVLKEGQSPHGLDFNRNFPGMWRPEKEQHGAGPFPLSQSETRSVAEFVSRHSNIAAFLALHTGIEVIIPPEGARPFSEFSLEDRALLTQLAQPGTEILGMKFESLFPVDYGAVYGDFGEWMYEHLGLPGFVVELWAPAARAGYSLKDDLQASLGFTSAEPRDCAAAEWVDGQGLTDVLVPFRPFDHPQVGKVEIGGWLQGFRSCAPDGAILEDIALKTMRFALTMGESLPAIRVREAEAIRVAPNLYKVGLTLHNTGFLPSNLTHKALANGAAKEVEVSLELPDGEAERIVGLRKQRLGHLHGYGGMARAEWLVRAEKKTEITLRIHGRGGGSRVHRLTLGGE